MLEKAYIRFSMRRMGVEFINGEQRITSSLHKMNDLDGIYERVHMVWDLYDGIRSGLAEYRGLPYYFECVFRDGNYTDTFELRPVDAELLAEATEQWLIYRAWERRFHSGEVPLETHPGHGGIVPRYDELERSINARLESLVMQPLVASANFRVARDQPALPYGCLREVEVLWTPAA